MSVVIKMDMPKSCFDCNLCYVVEEQIICRARHLVFDRKQIFTEIRNPDCPILCELPEKHGRLIDANAIALIDDDFVSQSDYIEAECAVENTPTIIEAEGEE